MLFLFCIDAKFYKKIFVGKLLTRSTRFTCFCTAHTSIFQKNFVKLFCIFRQILQKIIIFSFFSVISAQILMKLCRNFADILENVEIFNFPNFLNFLAKIPEFCRNFSPNSDRNSSFCSVPRRPNLSTQVATGTVRRKRYRPDTLLAGNLKDSVSHGTSPGKGTCR